MNYNLVAATNEATVVAEYLPEAYDSGAYQGEAALERDFIARLASQGYERVDIRSEAALLSNLRARLEALNGFRFSDAEWKRFFSGCLSGANRDIAEKTRLIQEDEVQLLARDDGTTKNVVIVDKKNVHNNSLQVLNQYEETGGSRPTRYDVTILVNGLPLVHVELKRRGVPIREAFNQIERYQRDSFWAASGLYEYVQVFVISNGTHTKYYSNTTRDRHVRERAAASVGTARGKRSSNSFEFTSYWADGRNRVICDLVDFTKTFFARHTLLHILTRYCVFTSEESLLVMWPYQIAATEAILSRVTMYSNLRRTGSVEAGGYVWHTTGSGKTLTSFKTAQLAAAMPGVDKVLFVVDRKDLDYQTMKEYDRFQKGAANGNTSTSVLKAQLEDPAARIIITTIQKLDVFVGRSKGHEVFRKHVVIIFDECHRSQFGLMHEAVTRSFKHYHIFGFTGTPIFAVNAGSGGNPLLRTTPQAFGDKLHTYTIVDAINDGNVLPFRIDYVNTFKLPEGMQDARVRAIDAEKALLAPERIAGVVSYILDHFNQKTKRQSRYTHAGRRLAGFNSILAVSSIPAAMRYYEEFRTQLEARCERLVVATIFSYSPNEEAEPVAEASLLPDEGFEADRLDSGSRDFLESAIGDYNRAFNVNFGTDGDKFENYYKDLSQRVKNREVDLLIVVNMFLTGFDATTLNTLWVDKNLRQHGLIQAFSRTNRILNSVKTFGNIVCFRDLDQATQDAIALFGDREAGGVVLLKTFSDYYDGYDEGGERRSGYAELISRLRTEFPAGRPIEGEEAEKEFIRLFGAILRLRNILSAFDDFAGKELLAERELQDYQGAYIDLYQDMAKARGADRECINDDVIFELELVKQVEVNIDYILMLVAKYHESNSQDKSVRVAIDKAIGSSLELRSKRELIEGFIDRVNASASLEADWEAYVRDQKERELATLIGTLGLKPDEARRYIDVALRDGALKTSGVALDRVLPAVSRFGGGSRAARKEAVIERLEAFFDKYSGLV